MKLVSVRQMQEIEKEANSQGISYELMMQNAGQGLAKIVDQNYYSLKEKGVLGLIGSGNNGGDTLVALAWLADHGWKTSAYLAGKRDIEDPLLLELIHKGGQIITHEEDPDFAGLTNFVTQSALLLDGILGTGIQLPLRLGVERLLSKTNELIAHLNPSLKIIAVDCPSGIDCDSGEASPVVVPAHMTITMAAIKQGLLKFPAFKFVGELTLVGIGLPEGKEQLDGWIAVNRFVPDKETIQSYIPDRPSDAHKGTFGTAVIAAGSANFPGASLLAGTAAYRIGAGLVTLAVPESIQAILAGHLPEATWILLPEESGAIAANAKQVLVENLSRATALLVGPGFNLLPTTASFLEKLLHAYHEITRNGTNAGRLPPLVIDADGLKLLTTIPVWEKLLPEDSILTPHPGEMAILTKLSTEEIQKDRVNIAEEFSSKWRQVVVLKGAFTVIASPDGLTAVIPVATPALARAGSGDVLAGLITGLRAQGVGAFESAVAGAWIHANAGLLAAKEIGNTASVIAGDIIKFSVKTINELQRK